MGQLENVAESCKGPLILWEQFLWDSVPCQQDLLGPPLIHVGLETIIQVSVIINRTRATTINIRLLMTNNEKIVNPKN